MKFQTSRAQERLLVTGKIPLIGQVHLSGAKNAALPALAATLLTNEPVCLKRIPHLSDVSTMLAVLGHVGTKSILHSEDQLHLYTPQIVQFDNPDRWVRRMRASILVLGPLLARAGRAKIALPGGCCIGMRPVNLHCEALAAMGAEINIQHGFIQASAPGGLKGAHFHFNHTTVTGTENVMMAATLTKGTTVLGNAAMEPEVVDLGKLLIAMGADIEGLGTETIVIHGVAELKGATHQIISDRLEAGTFLIAALMTQGYLTVSPIDPTHVAAVLDVLRNMGATIECTRDSITIDMRSKRPKSIDVTTLPYPGFPTDLLAPITAANVIASGHSAIKETIFENRFLFVPELMRMGAQLDLQDQVLTCKGTDQLMAAQVMATDLRASAGLILAALSADGTTVIEQIEHLDRGYERFEEKLSRLGGICQRIFSLHDHWSENIAFSHIA